MSNTKEFPELQVFKTVLIHCLIIITFPVLSFFLSKVLIFNGLLGTNSVPSNVCSAGVAIVVLHVAMGVFIYRAYFDDRSKTPVKKD